MHHVHRKQVPIASMMQPAAQAVVSELIPMLCLLLDTATPLLPPQVHRFKQHLLLPQQLLLFMDRRQAQQRILPAEPMEPLAVLTLTVYRTIASS
jgi:hypothetical protein